VRHWIRGGVANGKIRSAPKDRNAVRGEQAVNPVQEPTEEWQRIFFNAVDPTKFKTWFAPLSYDGERLIAPSSFHKNWVEAHYAKEIEAAFPDGVNFVVGQGEGNHATG
jgi:chromosomal replication initiation ATPase DnaA